MKSYRAVITQSNYIPWRGYFDMIDRADVVVLYDDAQYTRRDWRNRNRIKTMYGPRWLTIPVRVKGKYLQRIYDVEIAEAWAPSHWSTIEQAYRAAAHFETEQDFLKDLYDRAGSATHLSQVNRIFLREICHRLGVDTDFEESSAFGVSGSRTEKLLNICLDLGATSYLSGPSAKGYLDVELLNDNGVEVEWMSFDYPTYPQLHGSFAGDVSIVDLMLNNGAEAALENIQRPRVNDEPAATATR